MKTWCITAALVTAIGLQAWGERPMNILMIAVDDMRPELGCYGASWVKSPNLDRLAASGLLFERAYCQQAICGPSRASLLTGLRPDASGVHGNHTHYRAVHPKLETLPEFFRKRGYFTAACGKINHGVFPKGKAPKWDCMGDPQSWSVPAFRPGPRYYYTEEGIASARGVFKRMFPKRPIAEWDQFLTFGPLTEAPDVPDDTLYDGQVAQRAVAYLKDFARAERPFFLAVGFIKPHTPHIAPKRYFDLYERDKIALAPGQTMPGGAPSIAGHGSHEKRRYTDQPKKGPFSDGNQRETRHAYYACISYIDAQIGRVLDELDRQGLADHTIVMLWSDHGYHLGEKGLWGKTTNYELDTRVAMICRVPGGAAGAGTGGLVELVDVYPSLVDLAGFEVPEHCEGSSIAPLVENPARPWKAAAYSQFSRRGNRGYALTDGRCRYVEWIDMKTRKTLHQELYDHAHDPDERRNIAGDPASRAEVARLQKLLQAGQGWRSVREKLKGESDG